MLFRSAVAQSLGSKGNFLLAPANDAFVHAMHYTTLVAAVLALLGGLVVLRWMPGKPGQAVTSEVTLEDELALLAEEPVAEER